MPAGTTGIGCARACSTPPTPAVASGPTRPIARQQNEMFLERHGFVSHIHRRRPPGQPLPAHIRRGNARRSRDRAPVEHVFAVQKQAMGLFVRTIGLARARTKIGMANLAFNIRRLVQLGGRIPA